MEILDTSAIHDLEGNDSSDIEGQLSWADGILLVYSVTDRSSFELALSMARRLTCSSSSNSQSPTGDKLHASDDMHPIWSSFSSSSSSESVDALVDNASSSSSRVFSRHRRRHCVVLVGNKSDLLTERCVNVEPSPIDFVDSVSSSPSSSPSSSSPDAKFFYETSARDGGPEIAAAFDGLCRHVLTTRSRRQSGLAPIGRSASPIDAPANELIYQQTVQQVAPQIDKRRLAVLKTVNRLVKKLHVSRSASFSVKPASSTSSENNGQKSVRSHS